MRMDELRKMKMPARKPGLAVEIAVGKPGKSAAPDEKSADESELANIPEMDLLDELRNRDCVDDEMYSQIAARIQDKSAPPGPAESGPEAAY